MQHKRFKPVLTFKAIAGGKFRCNQDEKITTNPKGYLHAYLLNLQNRRPFSLPIIEKVTKKKIDSAVRFTRRYRKFYSGAGG